MVEIFWVGGERREADFPVRLMECFREKLLHSLVLPLLASSQTVEYSSSVKRYTSSSSISACLIADIAKNCLSYDHALHYLVTHSDDSSQDGVWEPDYSRFPFPLAHTWVHVRALEMYWQKNILTRCSSNLHAGQTWSMGVHKESLLLWSI